MRVVKALGILSLGFLMTFVVFPWLDAIKPTYRPYSLVLCDYSNTSDNSQVMVAGDDWALQWFEPASSYSLYQIKIKLWREGAGSGTMQAKLYRADASAEPTGALLALGTLAASSMSAAAPGDWETIRMLPSASVSNAYDYVIVLTYTPSATEWVNWRVNMEGSADFAYSEDGGEIWNHGEVP